MADSCNDCGLVPTAASYPGTTPDSAPPVNSSSVPIIPTSPSGVPIIPATSDPTAAAPPHTIELPVLNAPHLLIEFCDRCRWAPRASWMQTELLLTFPPPAIQTATLQPLNTPDTGGRFRVWVDVGDGKGWQIVWDRKTEGGFPELKILKQRVRNLVQPDLDLGHSDAKNH